MLPVPVIVEGILAGIAIVKTIDEALNGKSKKG